MKRIVGIVMFLLGFVLMVAAALWGKLLVPDIKAIGVGEFLKTAGTWDQIGFYVWSMAFPVGSSLLVIGVALFSENTRIQLVSLIALLPILIAILFLVPSVFGIERSPAFFGIGGSILLLLFSFIVWQWGSVRTGLQRSERTIADIKMAGYLFLMIGVWQTCGLGGMPAFGLYPEKALKFNSVSTGVALSKQVMVLYIIGWSLTAAGYIMQKKNSKK